MESLGADTLVLSSLMDVCWLMNLRGNDVDCTPVMLSFAAVTMTDAVLFVNPPSSARRFRRILRRTA